MIRYLKDYETILDDNLIKLGIPTTIEKNEEKTKYK